MEESEPQRSKNRRPRDQAHGDKYLGLTPKEVALRERMAQKFGRQAQHLKPSDQPAVVEESKEVAYGGLMLQQVAKPYESKSPQPRVDPTQKLRQLQVDHEKYRASIEVGHLLLKAKIGE